MDLDLTIRYLDDLTALNVTVPDKALAAADTYRAALTAAAEGPATDLQSGLIAGTITAKNVGHKVREAALRQTAQQSAHRLIRDLHTTINKVIRDDLRAHSSRIIGELQKTFGPAAGQITEAAKHFGPDTTADDIITEKPDVVKRFNQVATHITTLDQVSRTYRTLLSDVTRQMPDHIAALFVADADNIDDLNEVYRPNRSWLALAHSGYTLRLNTPDEAAKVVARAEAKAAEVTAAEKQRAIEANKFKHRFDLRAGAAR